MDGKHLVSSVRDYHVMRNATWRSTQAHVRSIAVHCFALVGIAYLTSLMWPLYTGFTLTETAQGSGNLLHHNATLGPDPYSDTDYPLRPAEEPWNISTSYPYPRRFSKTVHEGTWLRIATHPIQHEIVFDMLGDLYCMSTGSNNDNDANGGREPSRRTAYPILTGVPYDKEPEFSSDGRQIVFISDAGFGVDNIWTLPYTSCAAMARASALDDTRRFAIQQTNSTFRFFSSPAFHPSGDKIIATKWFLTGRPNGAGEIWEFETIGSRRQQKELAAHRLPAHGGRRLIKRKLPASWLVERYMESQLGSEQARYLPTGDGVVFSRNVRDDDSGKFSYNKDVHAGINAAFQLNTTTGDIHELVAAAPSLPNKPASPGGANMPRISRDGRTLAFVRRSGNREVLALRDMRSGTVHYAWDGLSYDVSTIPGFMGAYPNYGWEAGDQAIILWSQGQIWRVPLMVDYLGRRVADRHRKPEKLLFEAKINLNLGTTRYSTMDRLKDQELALRRQEFALRGLRVDHDGQTVVFEAAGDNYVAAFESGHLTPIPKPENDGGSDGTISCYAPSFFGKHQHVFLQACWDNENLTSFHLANTKTGTSTTLQNLPRGRYVSPVSDGTYLAYVRTGKDYLFGDVDETFGEGVWVGNVSTSSSSSSSAEGEATVALTALHRIPEFSSGQDTKLDMLHQDGRRLLLVRNPGSVVQYDLGSGQARKLVRGKTSVEMTSTASALHDNGNGVVVFRDFQHVWLSTQPIQDARAIWSKPGDGQTPSGLVRLSEHGGHDVSLSGNGQKVFWLLGSRLHVAHVSDITTQCQAASLRSRDTGECARPLVSSQVLNLTFESPLISRQAGQSFVITNATLVSMRDGSPDIEANATVILRDGKIVTASNASDIVIDHGTEVMDAQGGAVLPGFVDVHGHWGGFMTPYPMQSWEMETFLGYGVTTIHNPASNNVGGHVERNLIEKGRMYGPRVFHTGDVLYGSVQPPVYTEINSRGDARAALLRVKAEGGDAALSVKNYQLSARSARQRLLLEAAELDMLVVPEGGWSFDWGLTYFIDGYTSHEHPLPVPELYDDVLSLVAASGSSYTPIAVMNYGGIFGQHWVHQSYHVPGDAKLRKYVKHDILESLTEVKQAPRSSYLFFNTTKSTAKLAERGVRTSVGSHGEQPIGFLFHGEMRMMAIGGQSPYSVLLHATIGGATSLGLQSMIGSVEVGKLADLVVYPPGVDSVEKVWETSMHMKYVIRGGTLFGVEDGLVEMWPRKGRRQVRPYLDPDGC